MRVLERRATGPRPTSEDARERASRLEGWTRRLAVPRNFRAQPRENARARRFLGDFFEDLGYSVEIQGPYRNVVALPPHRTDLTLVAAHYDSVPGSRGADDNASGVAVMLAVASDLAARGAPNVGFVAFNAEEDGIAGSDEFVANGIRELGLTVAEVHVLEMVGFSTDEPGSQEAPLRLLRVPDRGNFLGLLANGRSHALLDRAFERAPVATPDLEVLGLKTYLGIERLLPVLLLSDHAPFWRASIPAMLWTDTSFFRNPHYHQMSDAPETLDYGFMERIATLVSASIG
jgi:hypothetical protein